MKGVLNLKALAMGVGLTIATIGSHALAQSTPGLPSRDGYFAYAWVTGVGTPDANYAYNPAGNIAVTSSGTGVYKVTFGGTHPPIRNVQITAYGNNNNTCKVNFWSTTEVNVLCFTPAGAPVNTAFVITVAS